jgi:hypothetical protein
MRLLLMPVLLACSVKAATIRGVVVEHQSGRPLARALVVVQPIAGTNGGPASVRSDMHGAFEIGPLAAGAYLVLASRRAFAPAQYGQKQWRGAGTPVVLEENASTFLSIRLQRFGAITGLVVDENDVGLQEHEVVAYRNTRPPVIAGKGKTDDRGVYRIWGLEPGSYMIRTVGKRYDEGDYLPTFSRETSRVDESRPVEVQLDLESTDVHVRPFPGRLYTLGGRAMVYPPAQVTLTLVSDLGAETTTADQQGNFKFPPMAPGPYELYAVSQGDRRFSNGAPNAAYQYLSLDRDNSDYRVVLGALPELRLAVEDAKGQTLDPRTVQILYRRKDLSGDGKPETLRIPQGRLALPPGRYDLMLAPSPTYYMSGFTAPHSESIVRGRPDGWNEVVLGGPGAVDVKLTLSSKPASAHGVARNGAHEPVAGVPVFLEAYDPESRRRIGELHAVRTDTRGQFEFYGLAPGQYRLLSTFEFQNPDDAQLDASKPRVVRIDEAQDLAVDLDIYEIR